MNVSDEAADILAWTTHLNTVVSECGCIEYRNIVCFKHKLRSIQFSGRGKTMQTKMESQWERDRPAYMRLRRNGLQPKSIKGSADLEQRATSQFEVEMGQLFDKKDHSKVTEAMAACREMDWTPKDAPDAVAAAKERRVRGV